MAEDSNDGFKHDVSQVDENTVMHIRKTGTNFKLLAVLRVPCVRDFILSHDPDTYISVIEHIRTETQWLRSFPKDKDEAVIKFDLNSCS